MTGFAISAADFSRTVPLSEPAFVGDIELSALAPHQVDERYVCAYLLVRLHGEPIGHVVLPVINGHWKASDLADAVCAQLSPAVFTAAIAARLREPSIGTIDHVGEILGANSAAVHDTSTNLAVTVAVCTKDRADQLFRCLTSLRGLSCGRFDVVVVDNGSSNSDTRELVQLHFPEFRYVNEPRPGLNNARNRAMSEASGDIIAYTDDDTVVDPGWVGAVARAFAENPAAACVTGLIAPKELENSAQVHFEALGGFGRGYKRYWYRVWTDGATPDRFHIGAGRFGAGANMAFRLDTLRELGGFDPALDVGTCTEGGGDLELFFRTLHEGHLLLYDSRAIVWHRHRDTVPSLTAQISTWGTAVTAFLTAVSLKYPRNVNLFARFGVWWIWSGYLRPLLRRLVTPHKMPLAIWLRPLVSVVKGPARYVKARRLARRAGHRYAPTAAPRPGHGIHDCDAVAIRTVEIEHGVHVELVDVSHYRATYVHVLLQGRLLGTVHIANTFAPIEAVQLRYEIASQLHAEVIRRIHVSGSTFPWPRMLGELSEQLADATADTLARPPRLVSIVVATRDRPSLLRSCLETLTSQTAPFAYELIVVDNNPASGLSRAVVRDFPQVVYVCEPVPGLARARNAGFRTARGEIIVTTDDDAVPLGDWLTSLIAPFKRADIGVVTGNVLPIRLGLPAERAFELIGGLSGGTRPFEVNAHWLTSHALRPAPVWTLGATANAAFRTRLLTEQEIGYFDESLGPGTPAGVGEDSNFFFKAIRAGWTLVYVPEAAVLHQHRVTLAALARQLFAYSKGHVAYLLTTIVDHGDLRALTRLLVVLPGWHVARVLGAVPALRRYPRRLAFVELIGFCVGPLAWAHARLRVRRRAGSDS